MAKRKKSKKQVENKSGKLNSYKKIIREPPKYKNDISSKIMNCANCVIEKNETNADGECDICCCSARQCCYSCFEDDCPIKEIYNIPSSE